MKILLVYLPFCTPATPPYSLANLYSFLKKNSKHDIDVLDLNLEFHKKRFPEFQDYYRKGDWADYEKKTADYRKLTTEVYSLNNKKVVNDQKPELFDEFLEKIKDKKPDVVAFSIVYSSQAFYAYSLIKGLDIRCIVGGPAVSKRLIDAADANLKSETELLEYVGGEVTEPEFELDFTPFELNEYFVPEPIIPLKITSTCFYRGCAFCSHPRDVPYKEYPLDIIKKTIVKSKQKFFFLIDDMIPTKFLLRFAEMVRPLDIHWTCQLRPTKDLIEILPRLKESGLDLIIWGVESGCDRILGLINKGTNRNAISEVLKKSHEEGIMNTIYIMFGFPSETKEEFIETIDFLEENRVNIDLISSSIFGLQKDIPIYNNPKKYGITKIIEKERTVLGPNITYEVKSGLSQKDASKLRSRYKKTLEKINKFPKAMNFFREHMLISKTID